MDMHLHRRRFLSLAATMSICGFAPRGFDSFAHAGTPDWERIYSPCQHGLAIARQRISAGDKTLTPALNALRAEAEEALKESPRSVMQKSITPPSGDKHDYMSYGPYWWPNPETKDGLPYVRRDGQVNPEAEDSRSDRSNIGRMSGNVQTLSLAWYFLRDERYAKQAARLLRVWFLSPDTRMNPHLQFGQAIPGITQGRDIGIIDTISLASLLHALPALESSEAWPAEDRKVLAAWFDAFLNWLLTSKHGISEGKTKNNHAVSYDMQVVTQALYLGKEDLAKKVLEAVKARRIATQIQPDGSQPAELARTKSFSYSLMNTRLFLLLAELGEIAGVDLWHYETQDGRSIRKAIEFLVPYVDPQNKWPHKQISRVNFKSSLYPILLRAQIGCNDGSFAKWIDKTSPQSALSDRVNLLYATGTQDNSK